LNFYFFAILTFFVIVLVEKLEEAVAVRFFRKQLEEIAEKEREIAEYTELSMIAMLCGEKEAYMGFQEIMNEIYAKLFFRRITFFTSLYFLLLSPYMILISPHYPNGAQIALIMAVGYFTLKIGLSYARQAFESYRAAKRFSSDGR